MASFRKRGRLWYLRFTNADGRRVEEKGHWDLVTTRALDDATFDPGIDWSLYPPPRRGHRGRRRHDSESQARGHGRDRDRGEGWTHKQTLCPFFAPRR